MRERPYFPLTHLAGIHVSDERRLHIAIAGTKAFYDGTHDERCEQALTLTGLAAPESVWEAFEKDWDAALVENHVYEDLHMRELMHNKGYFADFGHAEKMKLVASLWNVFGKHRPTRMRAYSCTVLLPDYERAKNTILTLREPEAICVNYCVGGLQLTEEELSLPKPILLYFDRGEPFMHTINRVWEKATHGGEYFGTKRGWPYQIRNIIPADRSYLPIQAADFLAWSVNRCHCTGDVLGSAFALSAKLMVQHFTWVYDYDEIVKDYPNG